MGNSIANFVVVAIFGVVLAVRGDAAVRGAAPAEGGDVSGDSIFAIRVHDEA